MTQDYEIKAVVAELDELSQRRVSDFDCGKLYCTTCGGTAYYIDKAMDRRTRARLTKIANNAELDDFSKFGFWCEYVRRSYPHQFHGALKTSLDILRDSLDLNDPRSIDKYLIRVRRVYKRKSPDLLSIIDRAIELALETKDASLIETLILFLGEDAARDHPELVDLAVLKSREYGPLERTLYYKLRNVREDVRNYVGDGLTVNSYSW